MTLDGEQIDRQIPAAGAGAENGLTDDGVTVTVNDQVWVWVGQNVRTRFRLQGLHWGRRGGRERERVCVRERKDGKEWVWEKAGNCTSLAVLDFGAGQTEQQILFAYSPIQQPNHRTPLICQPNLGTHLECPPLGRVNLLTQTIFAPPTTSMVIQVWQQINKTNKVNSLAKKTSQ